MRWRRFLIRLVLNKEQLDFVSIALVERADRLYTYSLLEKTADKYNLDKDREELYKINKYFKKRK